MYTIKNIVEDISRGCIRNNLNEDCFSFRIVYYTNEHGTGTKHYMDSTYGGLRQTLETIVRNNLTLENTLVVAQTTVRKDGRCVCLQSRSYPFSFGKYFELISGKREKCYIENNYGRKKVQWY